MSGRKEEYQVEDYGRVLYDNVIHETGVMGTISPGFQASTNNAYEQ